MMIIGIIVWAIGYQPVPSFQWWSDHMQRGVMCCDDRASCDGIGGEHAMNQFVRNLRAAVEWDVHKIDGRTAIGNSETAILAGKYFAADGLEDGCAFLCLKSGNRFSGCGIRV